MEIKDYIPDLTPQNTIENLTYNLEKIMGDTYKYVKISKLDETQWLEYIQEHGKEVKNLYNADQLNDDDKNHHYTWLQDDYSHTVILTVELPRDQIELSETGIKCSVLSGLFWGEVSNVQAMELGETTQICMDATYHWPTLIKGGNPDGVSCYMLALIALELKQLPICEMYLKAASIRENRSAMKAYAMLLIDRGSWAEGIHWLCRSILIAGDHDCAFTLASSLLRPENNYLRDARLAEFMLTRLVLEGFPYAYFTLGRLYLNGAEGVTPDLKKAQFLLAISAMKFDDEDAKRILENVDFTETKPEEPAEPQEKKEEEEGTSVVDTVIAGTLLAGVAALGYFAYKKIMQRRK